VTPDYDLIVVGAGPAGTTLATLVKKYRPDARVLILDRQPFPRHHVGESLLPGMVPVLKEMGVFEKIDGAGFPKKFGVVFVWGEDRKPWDADFNNLNLEMLQRYGKLIDTEFSWQVLRSRYDEILLRHAESCGVEARLGARAVEPIEEGGRISGVVIESDGGRAERLTCRTLADCSGQDGFLARARRTRRKYDELKNVAAYAYFKGAKWKFEFAGHPDKTKIFVCSVPEGWFWYIPIERDLVSVGLVSKAEAVKREGSKDMRVRFFDALKRCGEIQPLLAEARLMKGIDPADPERDFFTAGDWSYQNEASIGDGWIAAGDAAFFIDPLLSSGVMMAHLSGHRAAYTVLSAWREEDAGVRALLASDYDRFCREIGASFLSLVRHWYAGDPHARGWWGTANEALRAQAPVELDDKLAFVAVASGLTYYFEKAWATKGFLFGAPGGEHSWQWEGTKLELQNWTRQIIAIVETGFLRGAPDGPRLKEAREKTTLRSIPDSWIPSWRSERVCETTFLPSSAGRLLPIRRLRLPGPGGSSSADRRRLLPGPLWRLTELIDGRRSVGSIKRALGRAFSLPSEMIDGQVFRVLKDLAVLGAVSFEQAAGDGGSEEAASPSWDALRLGEAALMAGDPAAAEPLLTRAIEAGAPGAWPRALRGEAFRHLGRLEEAAADLDDAVRILEQPPAAPEAAGKEQVLAHELESEILAGWLEDRVHLFRAKLRLRAGDLPGAGADAEAALRANPRLSEALAIRAKVSLSRGDGEGARTDIELAKEIEASGRRNER
jgi:clorobiocin biosynthesis protein Clo-hal